MSIQTIGLDSNTDEQAETNFEGKDAEQSMSSNTETLGSQASAGPSGNTDNRSILDLAKDSGGELADKAFVTAKEKASSVVDEQKSNLAAGLGSIAGELRRTGESLRTSGDKNQFVGISANYGEKIADKVDGLSRYLEDADLRDMAGDLENYARRNPAVFIGGAFVLGLAATRFIKSSSSPSGDSGPNNVRDFSPLSPQHGQIQSGR